MSKQWIDTERDYFYVDSNDEVLCGVYKNTFHTQDLYGVVFVYSLSTESIRFTTLEAAKAYVERHY